MFDNFCKCSQMRVREEPCKCNCRNNFARQSSCRCDEPFFCPRFNSLVLRGPRGLPGPRGPQGVPGVSFLSNFANFVSTATQTIPSGGSVDLGSATILVGNAISTVARISTLNLAPGTYFVVANLSGITTCEGAVNFNLAIGADNFSFMNIGNMDSCEVFSLGGNTIVLVNENSTMSVINSSDSAVTVENISLSIIKIV